MKYLSHIMAILAAITAVAILSFLGYLFYLMNWNFDIVDIKSFTVPHEVHQGESIPYTLTFDKHLNYKPTTRYYVLRPNTQTLEIVTTSVNHDVKLQTITLAIDVPSTLTIACGYKLQVDVDYQIIFNRDIAYRWTSNEFCITAPKAQKDIAL